MRYTVPGVPRGLPMSAVAPHMTRAAGSGWVKYKGAVSGSPGTTAIPAPTTDTAPGAGSVVAQSMMGTARSSDAPQAWWPAKYYERSLDGDGTMGPVVPARIYSDNLMPVPAVDPRGRGRSLARPILQRGQTQITAPRVFQSWGGGGL